MATIIVLTTDNLDRLSHALLMAKCDYLSNSIAKTGTAWDYAKQNIDTLQALYDQIEAARNAQAKAAA